MTTETLCLYTTTASFILLFLYYMISVPECVKKEDKRSIRLCTVYALLFSSAIGLLVLTVSSISRRDTEQPTLLTVEKPTFNY